MSAVVTSGGGAPSSQAPSTRPRNVKVEAGPIAGLVVGVVFVCALCILLVCMHSKRRKRKQAQAQQWGAHPYDIKTKSQVLPLHLDHYSLEKHAQTGSMSSSPTHSSFDTSYHKQDDLSVPSPAILTPPSRPYQMPLAAAPAMVPYFAQMPAHLSHAHPGRNELSAGGRGMGGGLVAPEMLRQVSDAPSDLSMPRTVSRQGSFVNDGDEVAPSGFFLETRQANRLQLPPDGSPRTSDGGHGWWDTSIIDLRLEIDEGDEPRRSDDGRALSPFRPQIPIVKTTPPSLLLLTPPNPPWPHTPNLPYTPSAHNTPIVTPGRRVRSPSMESLQQREFRNAFHLVTANGTCVPMTSVPSPSVELRRTPFF
ncbi:hypothetical protein FA10DRAFT_303494 [Acaromyces ingoldii]|uniref:Uncharacterized protein n=1 Tax=Acaromyces ingoldii TaxID=215250 RepID=A0A316YIT5_9BASI|nr:hypothetical protein FA10DRAFT_303494 [Acaromyces ingoldii]PWN88538.1 hypothetical protein FA10DRAFT_303494 [Acaromyces ingoldii]